MRYGLDCFVTTCILLSLFSALQISLLAIRYNRSVKDINESFTPLAGIRSWGPHALIIGVRKGGTRALLDALGLHPNIKVVRRETHFFDANYSRGVDWYRSVMPHTVAGQLIVEKTPGYFTSAAAPRRIFEFDSSMKIILIVRDPVQRTISDFTQVYYNKKSQNKTLPIFESEVFLHDSHELNLDYKPIRNSLYHLHLDNWLRYFSLERILLINGDVFRGNPLSELRRVEKFLGLPAAIRSSQLVYNVQKGFFCLKKTLSSPQKCLGSTKGREHRKINQSTVEILGEKFQYHNEKFFKLINRIYSW